MARRRDIAVGTFELVTYRVRAASGLLGQIVLCGEGRPPASRVGGASLPPSLGARSGPGGRMPGAVQAVPLAAATTDVEVSLRNRAEGRSVMEEYASLGPADADRGATMGDQRGGDAGCVGRERRGR